MKDLNKGVHVSPNIQSDSEVYEIENTACDPENKIEAFLRTLKDWKDKKVLDIGCGTGFHLPYFAKEAEHVYGVEPHDGSRLRTMKRICDEEVKNVSVLKGSAEAIVLEDESIDFAHSRFAYFWGEGCEEGLKEVFRVLKPDGLFVMIDNNLEQGTFGPWVKESFGFLDSKQLEVESFWKNQGFELQTIESEWVFKTREDLESVLKIEFPKSYSKIIKSHEGLCLEYVFNLYFKSKA